MNTELFIQEINDYRRKNAFARLISLLTKQKGGYSFVGKLNWKCEWGRDFFSYVKAPKYGSSRSPIENSKLSKNRSGAIEEINQRDNRVINNI